MAGMNVGSVFMDAYINTTGFTAGIDNVKSYSEKAFSGIGSMITGEWAATKTGTDTTMKELFASVANGFLSIQTETKKKMALTSGAVSGGFETIKERIHAGLMTAKTDVADGITEMKTQFGDLTSFLAGSFQMDWESAFAAIDKTFRGVWEGLPKVTQTAVNGCIKMMNGFVDGVWGALGGVVDLIGDLISEFGSLIGFEDWGFSMPKAPQIPMLASGGIIEKPTLALMGERGREAVMPLENNTGWMVELANTIGAVMASGTAQTMGGDGARVARLYVDGRQLAETLFDPISDAAKRRGIELKTIAK